jgi:hypothetical protein
MEEAVWVKTKKGGCFNVHKQFENDLEATAEGYMFCFTEGAYDYYKKPLTEYEEACGWHGTAGIRFHALFGRVQRDD